MDDLRNLHRLCKSTRIPIPTDEQGYAGRECPGSDCGRYFKIMFGTGLETTNCYCPYCGRSAEHSEFATPDQNGYATSLFLRKAQGAIIKDLERLNMRVEPSPLPPIQYYSEKELETHVTCHSCTLQYAVYGVFAFCPDCGQHNSLQILRKSFEVVERMLKMPAGLTEEVMEKLVENALEDCVSAFDGFGHEMCRVYSAKAVEPERVDEVSFQSLEGGRASVQKHFGYDLASPVDEASWKFAVLCFQKRHLFAHKMGVVDEKFVKRTGACAGLLGRKAKVTEKEVADLIQVLTTVAEQAESYLRSK